MEVKAKKTVVIPHLQIEIDVNRDKVVTINPNTTATDSRCFTPPFLLRRPNGSRTHTATRGIADLARAGESHENEFRP